MGLKETTEGDGNMKYFRVGIDERLLDGLREKLFPHSETWHHGSKVEYAYVLDKLLEQNCLPFWTEDLEYKSISVKEETCALVVGDNSTGK
jgi:hypothetical protein